MPSDAENIATIKSNALTILADISANPKPSYNIDGQSVSWTEYQKMLMSQVEWADTQLNSTDPFEIVSIGHT